MNTATTQTNQARANDLPPTASESRLLIRAMERAREKEVAHELYGMLVDLIAAYLPIDVETWAEDREEPGWLEKHRDYPKRYPVDMAIRKTAPYLSKELRYQAQALLDDMYGERMFGWQELGQLSFNNQSAEAFWDNKVKKFNEYVKQFDRDPQTLSVDERNDFWVFMMREEDYELFARLDDIFADYLRD